VALLIEGKKAIVEQLHDLAAQAMSASVVDYRGITANDMNFLRANAREVGVTIRVARNTLAKRAFEETELACLSEALLGPLFIAFSKETPGADARVLRDFMKENEALEVKALSVSGQLLDASQLEAIASLPTYEEALAQMMSVMTAPITKLVRTLNEPTAKLVRTLAAVRDQKQAEQG